MTTVVEGVVEGRVSAGTAGGAPRGRTPAARRSPMVAGHGPLARVPAVVAFVVVAAVFAAGVLIGGTVGMVLLGLLAAGVAVLLAVTWPRLSPAERTGRLLVLGVLVAVAIGLTTGAG